MVLLWNERNTRSEFEVAYDQLIIKHAIDYVQVDHRNINQEQITAFFDPLPVQLEVFANKQVFDIEGLKGRLLSSSYMPTREEPGYQPMINDLTQLFNRHQHDNLIEISYDTKVYAGRFS